jgi:hypothetical protein
MALTNFPRGISSQGVPVVGGGNLPIPRLNGLYFFVDSVNGNNSNDGLSVDKPFSTIAYAITKCTASRGDVINVMPGHSETMTAAGTITLNVVGVSVMGQGNGNNRPTIAYSTAIGASFDISAASVTVQNLLFVVTGFDAVTSAVNVTAAGVSILDCDFVLANATNQAVTGLTTTAAADRLSVLRCRFWGTTDAGSTSAITIVGGDAIKIADCFFSGAYTTTIGAINQITTTTTNCQILNNYINNLTASSAKCMVFTASSTGQISGNCMQVLTGTAPIAGAAMSWVGRNYYAATIATAGTLI